MPTEPVHRVGKDAVITWNGSTLLHNGGTVEEGGGVDTVTYPDGWDRQAITNTNRSGTFQLIVPYGQAAAFVRGEYGALVIADGTNTLVNGEVLITGFRNTFANDQGWNTEVTWASHGVHLVGAGGGGGGGGD